MNHCLVVAVENDNPGEVEQLLEQGADVHDRNDEAIYLAAREGHTDMVALLLGHGADVHARNYESLCSAASCGHTDTVALLLGHGADVHAGNDRALRFAVREGHTDTVALLLERGANIHAKDDEALCWGAGNGHTGTVALLLEHGADVHAGNDRALHVAAREGHTDTVALLKASESLKSLEATTPPNLVYGTAVIASKLGLKDHTLMQFVRQANAGPHSKALSDRLGIRPYLEATAIRDMATESAEAILLPQLLLDAGLSGKQALLGITEVQVRRWTDRLLPLAGQLLLGGQSVANMLALAGEWHIPGNALPDALRPLRGGTWHAVIPEITTPVTFKPREGKELPVIIKALTSQSELAQESNQLKHCVATADYGTQCRRGETHVLSFQAGGQSLATLEVNVTDDAKAPLSNLQFRGEQNGKPPKAAEFAWQWLQEQLKTGKQMLNRTPESGWGELPMPNPPPPAIQAIGYEPSEAAVNRRYHHLQGRLKLKEAMTKATRHEGGFWTPRNQERGYSWRQALPRIREGFDGVMKEGEERSGLHELIQAAGLSGQWGALVSEARLTSHGASPETSARGR